MAISKWARCWLVGSIVAISLMGVCACSDGGATRSSTMPSYSTESSTGSDEAESPVRYVGLGASSLVGADTGEEEIEGLYRSKAEELLEAAGPPAVVSANGMPALAGLMYLGLYDFGTGEYLVSVSPQEPGAPKLEVWARDCETGALAAVYEGDAGDSVSFNGAEDGMYLLRADEPAGEYGREGDDVQAYQLYGAAEDGSLEVAHEIVRVVSGGRDPETFARLDDAFKVDGRDVTEAEWDAAMMLRNNDAKTHSLVAYAVDDDGPLRETLGQTRDALETLGVAVQEEIEESFECKLARVTVPASAFEKMEFRQLEGEGMAAWANGVELFEIFAPMGASREEHPAEARKRTYSLGYARLGFDAFEVQVEVYYLDPSGLGTGLRGGKQANDLALEQLCGLGIDGFLRGIELSDLQPADVAGGHGSAAHWKPPDEVSMVGDDAL